MNRQRIKGKCLCDLSERICNFRHKQQRTSDSGHFFPKLCWATHPLSNRRFICLLITFLEVTPSHLSSNDIIRTLDMIINILKIIH